jgi:NADH:ubiquinone reductase (H+-translocating)
VTCQDPRPEAIRVVVIGAGYAGMIATNRFLGSLTKDEKRRTTLTVVNPRSLFVERIRLHELAAGSRDTVTIPLQRLLHPDAVTMIGRARFVDSAARTVRIATATGELDLPYDYLVYAVGSVAAASIPGAVQHGFLLADFEGAAGAADAIEVAGPNPRIAVVGGGFTAVETASELAAQRADAQVRLYCAGQLVADMRPAARNSLTRTLRRLGVHITEDSPVTRIEAGKLHLAGGQVHAFDVCILAASFTAPDLAAISGLPVDQSGRMKVDEHLRCLDEPNVIGAGDAIVAPAAVAAHLRMGCAAALPLGAQAADTLLASIRGAAPTVLSIGFVIQCISLGRKNGYIQLVRPDDTPRPVHVGGRAGAAIKEKICQLVVDSPKKERTSPGTYSWPKGPNRKPGALELPEQR